MKFIVMNSDQANKIMSYNRNDSLYALVPIERQNGIYILQASIIEDDRYSIYSDLLSSFPQMDDSDPKFPAILPPPDLE